MRPLASGVVPLRTGLTVERISIMATPLIDYLVKVDTSPKEAVAFRKNPKAAMAAAGLSKKNQAILQSRNPRKIREAVFTEKPTEAALCPINRLFTPI
jgi:hypothetical protein